MDFFPIQFHARVLEKLASAGIEISSIDGLQEVFEDVPSPLMDLKLGTSRRDSTRKPSD